MPDIGYLPATPPRSDLCGGRLARRAVMVGAIVAGGRAGRVRNPRRRSSKGGASRWAGTDQAASGDGGAQAVVRRGAGCRRLLAGGNAGGVAARILRRRSRGDGGRTGADLGHDSRPSRSGSAAWRIAGRHAAVVARPCRGRASWRYCGKASRDPTRSGKPGLTPRDTAQSRLGRIPAASAHPPPRREQSRGSASPGAKPPRHSRQRCA